MTRLIVAIIFTVTACTSPPTTRPCPPERCIVNTEENA